MAEVVKDEKGNIKSVIVRDYAGYRIQVDAPSKETGRVRITTSGKSNTMGAPVDLEPAEARRLAHDLIDIVGEGG